MEKASTVPQRRRTRTNLLSPVIELRLVDKVGEDQNPFALELCNLGATEHWHQLYVSRVRAAPRRGDHISDIPARDPEFLMPACYTYRESLV
jgi:hypothetical protein